MSQFTNDDDDIEIESVQHYELFNRGWNKQA